MGPRQPGPDDPIAPEGRHARLEIVLKCDSAGSVEAVRAAIEAIQAGGAKIEVIQAGVGSISKKDVLMAQTGSRLIVGFNVDAVSRLDMELEARCVEIRLYEVIYNLTGDLEKIVQSFEPRETGETILGRGKVIAVFSAGRKGIIIGCEVLEGVLVAGKPFRLISAMGPVYTGKIDSMQIERQPVKQAQAGRNAGIFMAGRKKAVIGDQVECFEFAADPGTRPWRPTCGIFRRG